MSKRVGTATPDDIARALRSRDIRFVEEVAWRVGYHKGDDPDQSHYHDLLNRAALLETLPARIADIQAQQEES